jgi:hypothetical protein
VLVDEAHRSHGTTLHSNLLNALPNCARIGFTGTPIIMGARKRTHDIFGDFLDRYTLKESEADGATVPILYEGRTAEGAVADGRDLDQLFEDLFSERPADELEAIKRKYATKGHVLEAPRLIAAKARDILRHYVENILPNGLKAQVVAYSRLAAIRYTAALAEARDELVAEAEALEPKLRDLDDAALEPKPRKVRAAVRAWRSLAMLRQIEFATIISGGNNDDPAWKEWTDSPKVTTRIARFKKPLGEPTEKTDPLAFLVVCDSLADRLRRDREPVSRGVPCGRDLFDRVDDKLAEAHAQIEGELLVSLLLFRLEHDVQWNGRSLGAAGGRAGFHRHEDDPSINGSVRTDNRRRARGPGRCDPVARKRVRRIPDYAQHARVFGGERRRVAS